MPAVAALFVGLLGVLHVACQSWGDEAGIESHSPLRNRMLAYERRACACVCFTLIELSGSMHQNFETVQGLIFLICER